MLGEIDLFLVLSVAVDFGSFDFILTTLGQIKPGRLGNTYAVFL
jgi:hypothetical protein